MKFLNFGSLNMDHSYRVQHIVAPGETITSEALEVSVGGKGLNQSIALARAGAAVFHAGATGGEEGAMLKKTLDTAGVDTRHIDSNHTFGGRAIIQVDQNGQNSIVLFPAANREITPKDVERVLANFEVGDVLVLQNETSCLDEMIRLGAKKGMRICLNPSPADHRLDALDFSQVEYLLLNEIEGEWLTGETDEAKITDCLLKKYPGMKVVLTLGRQGAVYADAACRHCHGIYNIPVVNTTAAGDTFTGFFLASVLGGESIPDALRLASGASSLAVSRAGAASSIPTRGEVEAFLQGAVPVGPVT